MAGRIFPNFKVSRDDNYDNLSIGGINVPSPAFTDEEKTLLTTRNISRAQSIKLTFANPNYTFSPTRICTK